MRQTEPLIVYQVKEGKTKQDHHMS